MYYYYYYYKTNTWIVYCEHGYNIHICKYQSGKLYLYSYWLIFSIPKYICICICQKNVTQIYLYLSKNIHPKTIVFVFANSFWPEYISICIQAWNLFSSHTAQIRPGWVLGQSWTKEGSYGWLTRYQICISQLHFW